MRNELKELFTKKYKKSYSQLGEDLVVDFILNSMGIEKPFYLDIGSNDPETISNTYAFYLKGAQGVCVEPNPAMVKKHKQKRNRDIVIQAGISPDQSAVADYYLMNWHEFNTFDKERAEQVQKHYKGRNNIVKVEKIPLITVKELLTKYVNDKAIDFLSLDVEGLDLKILQAWDFDKYAPKLICVETCSPNLVGRDAGIDGLLKGKGYKLVAENPINGIYSL
jgi:FkbM family methyltransferase